MNKYIILAVILSLALCAQGKAILTSNRDNTIFSPLNNTQLTLLDNGNVVFSYLRQALWTTHTAGKGVAPYQLVLQENGNLELIDSTATVLWSSNSASAAACAPFTLVVGDLSLSINDCQGKSIWDADVKVKGSSPLHSQKRNSNACYGYVTSCTSEAGFSSTQMATLVGYIQTATSINAVYSDFSNYVGNVKVTIFQSTGSYYFYSEWVDLAACSCTISGTTYYYTVVIQ